MPSSVLTSAVCLTSPPCSQDGRNWARIEGEHHSGGLFDVGGPGSWDELFIGAPQVCCCWGHCGEEGGGTGYTQALCL